MFFCNRTSAKVEAMKKHMMLDSYSPFNNYKRAIFNSSFINN